MTQRSNSPRELRWLLLLLLLSAAMSLLWSNAKLLNQDEIYSLQTDSVGSAAEIIHIQRAYPVSLDPLIYHLSAHASMKLLGRGAMGMRLPSLLGFLLLQLCLWQFIRRLAGERAGLLAAALPALSAAFYYAAEGRPYGLLLGWYGAAVVCWQAAIHRTHRSLALAGLALSLALALNTHYFGVLLLLPFLAVEIFRTARSRHADWGVLIAGAAGCCGILGILPFRKAAGEFRTNYYGAGSVGLHGISMAYRSIIVDYTRTPMWTQRFTVVLLVAAVTALAWRTVRYWASEGTEAEWVLLLAFAALPFAGLLLAAFVTHSIEVRYLLGALLGLAGFVALALAPALRSQRSFTYTGLALVFAIVAANLVRAAGEQQRSDALLTSLRLTRPARAAFRGNPEDRLYIQDMGHFEVASEYQPEPEVRRTLTLVYSRDNELRWNRHDTMALTAMHLARITSLNIVPFAEVEDLPGEHLFAIDHTGWDWTDQAFAADSAEVAPLGKGAAGDIVGVRFPAASSRH